MARRGQSPRTLDDPAVVAGAGSHDFGTTGGDPSGPLPIFPTESLDEAELVRMATECLGVDHVGHWVRSRIPSLGNHTPYELMQTEEGRRQVECVLLKIEHGVY